MANIATENINTLAQLASSISDGDYIYIYKAASHSFARIEKSVFLQAIGGASSSQTITNVDIIQEKFDALIDALANYAFIDGKSDSMKIGELDWESQGGGDEPTPTPTPTLTSPTDTSINVGTISASGTSVSIQKTVRGSNITDDGLTVAVTGEGFSVAPTTITKTEAETGQTITITYSNSETQSSLLTATGSLQISGGGITTKTIPLTASKQAEGVTPTPTGYVTDGLVLHLDGKNQGSTNGSWIDSKGLKEFVLQGDAAVHKDGNNQADGVQFDGDTSHATFDAAIYSGSTSSFPTFENGTIEVVFTPLTGFISGGRPLFVTNNANGTYDICAHWVKTNNQFCFVSSDTTSNAKNATAPLPNTFSDGDMQVISATMNNGNYLIVQNGVSSTGTPTVSSSSSNKKSGAGRLRLGSMMDNTLTDRCSPVIIHEVRVYSGHLTEQQMKDNQAVDAERYGVILANS